MRDMARPRTLAGAAAALLLAFLAGLGPLAGAFLRALAAGAAVAVADDLALLTDLFEYPRVPCPFIITVVPDGVPDGVRD